MNPNWYRTFFEGPPVEFWRQAATPEWTSSEVDLAWRELGLAAGSRVLDCPCGHGRHSLELTRRGCQVIGIDYSEHALKLARQDAAAEHLLVDYRQGDMQELPSLPTCDAALTLGNSLFYIDHAATCRFFQSVARALRKGGRWLLNTGTVAESILVHLKPELTFEMGELSARFRNTYRVAESCLETVCELTQGGQTDTRTNWQFVFTVGEMRRMLASAGLQSVAMYGTVTGEPYELGSHQLFLVAERE
jgi:cyclopropane fatty-acyl-phospholipid synthase-like methyltransferase